MPSLFREELWWSRLAAGPYSGYAEPRILCGGPWVRNGLLQELCQSYRKWTDTLYGYLKTLLCERVRVVTSG